MAESIPLPREQRRQESSAGLRGGMVGKMFLLVHSFYPLAPFTRNSLVAFPFIMRTLSIDSAMLRCRTQRLWGAAFLCPVHAHVGRKLREFFLAFFCRVGAVARAWSSFVFACGVFGVRSLGRGYRVRCLKCGPECALGRPGSVWHGWGNAVDLSPYMIVAVWPSKASHKPFLHRANSIRQTLFSAALHIHR